MREKIIKSQISQLISVDTNMTNTFLINQTLPSIEYLKIFYRYRYRYMYTILLLKYYKFKFNDLTQIKLISYIKI